MQAQRSSNVARRPDGVGRHVIVGDTAMVRLTDRTGAIAYAGLAVAVAALAGVAATTSAAGIDVGVLTAGFLLAVLLTRFGVGCAAGLLILASLDALPGPNLETTRIANSITAQDLAVVALVALLIYENARDGFRLMWRAPWGRALAVWSTVFLAWYAATVARTWTATPVPLIHAVTYSRDFLYFALLLPLMFGPLRRPNFRNTALVTLAIGAVVASVAQGIAVAGSVSVSLLVHTYQVGAVGGLTRLYTSASDIPFAGLPLGIGLALFASSRGPRLLGAVLAITSLAAVLLGLTRAMYLGELVGLTAAALLALLNTDARARHGRRQFTKAGAVVLIATCLVVIYAPASVSNSAISGVSQRASSLVSDLTGSTVTDPSLQTRATETTGIEAAIGSHWLFGLGFLDPTYDYVAQAPEGNIRNPDVSLLGSISTIGVFGTAIYAFPLVAILLGLAYRRWTIRKTPPFEWLAFGAFAWCVAALIASVTLGLFFSPAQVTGSALVLALAAATILTEPAPVVTRTT
jgi:hypothetical protein